jgi:hypothetical protein
MKEIEGFEELKRRYLNGNRRVKDEILKSLSMLHGYHRKSAIRLLNRGIKNILQGKRPGKRGRRSRYQDPEFIAKLRQVWGAMDWQCGRNMQAVLPRWLPAFEEEYGSVREELRERLLTISPATIDRLLKPYRVKSKCRGGTRASSFRNEIPISTKALRDDRPGHIEVDTVAHCGGEMSGRFMWSFTATDIATGWTELRCVWAKGMQPIIDQFSDMRAYFPFPVLSFDSDNGGEFINRALFLFLQKAGIPQSRSRAYEKNDNAHVEQKNRTHVRHYLGDIRIDNPELTEALNLVMRDQLSVLRNFFFPTRKLLSTFQAKGKTYKVYDQPQTPFQRVLASSHVPQRIRDQLSQFEATLNPIKLQKQLRSTLRQVLKHASVTSNCEASGLSV